MSGTRECSGGSTSRSEREILKNGETIRHKKRPKASLLRASRCPSSVSAWRAGVTARQSADFSLFLR
jgi:hypothetical protein